MNNEINILDYTNMVRGIVKKYRPNNTIFFDDMIQAGYIGLLHAKDRYDGRGKFSTYATIYIKKYVSLLFKKHRETEDIDAIMTLGKCDAELTDDAPRSIYYNLTFEYLTKLSDEQQYIIGRVYGIRCPPNTITNLAKELNMTRCKLEYLRNKALKALRGHFNTIIKTH